MYRDAAAMSLLTNLVAVTNRGDPREYELSGSRW